ncbi:MAG TPA: bacillithiol biosynthesis cysteine-adding enzyme BshC [Bryobacteraceae bacterium]|nr:bacillithiol biosynthesis cysteine-adding enzyme BshC [Bryobacteraceae bacterium]
MEPSCVRQTQIPGTSKLFGDYLYQFDRVSCFFSHNFADAASFPKAAADIDYPESRRCALVAALRQQNGDSASLDLLAQPGTLAVVTGQQVGLFSGPSYTVFKALTAVKLAESLSKEGIPAVPVFWLASEDHDLAEVDHVWFFNQDAQPGKISLANAVTNGGPVGEVELSELPWPEIRESLGDLPFADETVERLRAAYPPGSTFTSGFKALLQDILREYGLLFLDPLDPAIREMARPFLANAAKRVPELTSALKARDHELAEAGYHSQVHLDDNSSLLFLLNEGKRSPLRWKDGEFVARDQKYVAADLCGISDRLSPNALLRPVMQDYLLPTVAYVGGPAEIAYMAQTQVLYSKLLGRMPVIFPRNSFTLLDARAEKIINHFHLSILDLLDHQEQVKGKIARQMVPTDLAEQFRELEISLSESLSRLQQNLHDFDPTLEAALQKSHAKMLYQLRHLSSKAARETLRRDELGTKKANFLINLVYPQRHLQERFFSIIPFLAKHGLDLPQTLLGMAQLTCPDHMVRTI